MSKSVLIKAPRDDFEVIEIICGSGSSGENRVWASTAQPRQVLANNGVPNALVGSAALPVGMAKIKTGLTGDMTTLAVPEPIASLPKFYTSTMPAIHSVPRDPGVPHRGPPYGNPGNCLPHPRRATTVPGQTRRSPDVRGMSRRPLRSWANVGHRRATPAAFSDGLLSRP